MVDYRAPVIVTCNICKAKETYVPVSTHTKAPMGCNCGRAEVNRTVERLKIDATCSGMESNGDLR